MACFHQGEIPRYYIYYQAGTYWIRDNFLNGTVANGPYKSLDEAESRLKWLQGWGEDTGS